MSDADTSSDSLLDRRSYLKLAGATTTALASTVAIGSASANEEYDVIELDANEAVTYDLDDGETFENKLIDQTAAGATFAIRARGVDDFTVRNIGFYGIGDRWNDSAANQHMLLSGNGTVENVYISNLPTPDDEQSSNTPMGGIYIRPSHSGHIDIRHTYIEGMGNNASYADRPGRRGGGGTVAYENCYHCNNTVSQFRIGTSGSIVRNSVGIVDDPDLERGSYISGSSRTARGVWAWHNDNLRVENSCFYVSPSDPEGSNTFHARMHDESSGSRCVLNVTDCYVNSDAPNLVAEGPGSAEVNITNLTESPTASVLSDGGVPTSAEMAASGGREYVDPFDEDLKNATSDETEDEGEDGDNSESASTLRIDGEGSSERSDYRLLFDGEVAKRDDLSEWGNNATVGEQSIEGFVRGGIDGFEFTGELLDVEIEDGPTIYVDGEAIDADDYSTQDDQTDGEPVFDISIVETNAPLPAGEDLNVRVEVANTGKGSGTDDVSLKVSGYTVDSDTVSLDPGQSTTVTLTTETLTVYRDIEFQVSAATDDDSDRETITLIGA